MVMGQWMMTVKGQIWLSVTDGNTGSEIFGWA